MDIPKIPGLLHQEYLNMKHETPINSFTEKHQ